ncbi:hypothetical protein PUN28_005030 [Cardiocondyla obscurior]|uniref:Cytochrome P450 n=1 Tax=Cardiocondyla obscurior TaxID=286306 RepID=A0AAW2GFL5_9HYME
MSVVLLSLILGAFLALYFYLRQKNSYWQKRGIPCADGALPIFGHMLSVISMRETLSDFSCKVYNDNKKHSMVGVYEFITPSLMILEPELVKTVMQANFSSFSENFVELDPKVDPLMSYNPFVLTGEKWQHNRKRLTYAFSSAMRLKVLLESVKKVCTQFGNYIDGKLQNVDKAEFELKSLFARYTAQVVAAAGFGVDGYCFDEANKEISFRKLGQSIFQPSLRTQIMFSLVVLIPSLNRIFKVSVIPKKVDNFFRTLVAELMEQRRKDGLPRYDFLHLMAELERSENDTFDTEMLTGHVMSFVIDGYESSSSVMSFIGFHLAHYPKVQEKLREEIVSVLKKYKDEITYDGLKEMTYMDQVISETLRLLPAGVLMKKRCTEEFELKGSDGLVCRVKPGTTILIPAQALHTDSQYWENPQEYDPERFNPDRKNSPRICVGMRMAQLMLKAGLAMLIKKYRMELSPKTQVPLKMVPGTILPTPKGGLWVYFQHL